MKNEYVIKVFGRDDGRVMQEFTFHCTESQIYAFFYPLAHAAPGSNIGSCILFVVTRNRYGTPILVRINSFVVNAKYTHLERSHV